MGQENARLLKSKMSRVGNIYSEEGTSSEENIGGDYFNGTLMMGSTCGR